MDYIMLSALAPVLVLRIFISYNIACQFKINFFDRMEALPNHLKLPDNVSTDRGIPKCHCPMHKLPCQAPHSLNFKSGVGRTDGEGIERSWAEMNRVANSTKEMGPGSRHDTLDDHFGHHNWRKYVSLGKFCPFFIGLIANLLLLQGQLYIPGFYWLSKNRNDKNRFSTNSLTLFGREGRLISSSGRQ